MNFTISLEKQRMFYLKKKSIVKNLGLICVYHIFVKEHVHLANATNASRLVRSVLIVCEHNFYVPNGKEYIQERLWFKFFCFILNRCP